MEAVVGGECKYHEASHVAVYFQTFFYLVADFSNSPEYTYIIKIGFQNRTPTRRLSRRVLEIRMKALQTREDIHRR